MSKGSAELAAEELKKGEEEPVKVKDEVVEEVQAEGPEKSDKEPVRVKDAVVEKVRVEELPGQKSKEDITPKDDKTPLEVALEEPAQEVKKSSTDTPAEDPLKNDFDESSLEYAAAPEPPSDDARAEEDDEFGSMGEEDDFGDDDFDDFREMGETAAGDDDGFDDFDAFEEADSSESFAEPAPPPQPQPTFVIPEIPVPILDFESPDGLSQALTIAMDKMFPVDPSQKRKPSSVEGRTFLTERRYVFYPILPV